MYIKASQLHKKVSLNNKTKRISANALQLLLPGSVFVCPSPTLIDVAFCCRAFIIRRRVAALGERHREPTGERQGQATGTALLNCNICFEFVLIGLSIYYFLFMLLWILTFSHNFRLLCLLWIYLFANHLTLACMFLACFFRLCFFSTCVYVLSGLIP